MTDAIRVSIQGIATGFLTLCILSTGALHANPDPPVQPNTSISFHSLAGSDRFSEFSLVIVHANHASSETEGENSTTTNPYEGNTEAIKEGAKLYEKMNCYGCRDRDGGGGMGSTLREPSHWQYGESDAALFETIRKGRPRMPGFKKHLTVSKTWKLIAYLRTFARDHES